MDSYIDDRMDDEDDEINNDNEISIISSMMKSIHCKVDGDKMNDSDLGKTKDYILNVLHSNICLVCIDPVNKNVPAWNCKSCFTMLHLQCIQMWIREGVHQKSLLSPQLFPNKEKIWHCPKCRCKYSEKDAPKKYFCYCGKVDDPQFDPWLIPHSCGNVCEKQLPTNCGHRCLLLCHPGPCPPCPKTVSLSCHCGQSGVHKKRCGQPKWNCSKICNKTLACNLHKCSSICHPGECSQCIHVKKLKCICGRNVKNVNCSEKSWNCLDLCNKLLSCGHHTCTKVCHVDECGGCPKFRDMKCPCGKTKFDLPCTTEVPTCMESCGKLLLCGQHSCTLRCHLGPCGTCREMSLKKCRCGKHKKELQCFKEYLCEAKCQKMKTCGIHQCKRKCCDGDCPPCNVICSKTLSCRNHKCASECHEGRCYPCVLSVELSCNCGLTKLSIPCGAERFTKNPRCTHPCNAPPICHHLTQETHVCHFGTCPPCKQICNKKLPNCTHNCMHSCHAVVKTKMKNREARAGPWDVKNIDKYEIISLDCPPCDVIVNIYCLGKHEALSMRCCESGVRSCGRKCGRLLACQQHTCQMECHTIEDVSQNDSICAGKTCEECELICENKRPEGCTHSCLLMCHNGACPPCKQMLRMRCHCEMVVRHIECFLWLSGDEQKQLELQSCGAQCPKMLTCGHQCKAKCHAGACPEIILCEERVRQRCECKRRKADFKCFELLKGKSVICDNVCEVNKLKIKELKDAAEREEKAKKKKVPTATLR